MASFPAAPISREQGKNASIITQEIAILELRVLQAIANNEFTVSASDTTIITINSTSVTGSPMTMSTAYYNAWKLQDNAVKEAEMDEVIGFFRSLGYAINRISNSTGTLFHWQISW